MEFLASVFFAATILWGCNANEAQVPQVVKNAFENEYPVASYVDWEQEGDQYIVDFRANDFDIEITYDSQGNVIEKNGDVADEALPPTSREVN